MVMGLYGLQHKEANDRDGEAVRRGLARSRLRGSGGLRAGKKHDFNRARRRSIHYEPVETQQRDEIRQVLQRRKPFGEYLSILPVSE